MRDLGVLIDSEFGLAGSFGEAKARNAGSDDVEARLAGGVLRQKGKDLPGLDEASRP